MLKNSDQSATRSFALKIMKACVFSVAMLQSFFSFAEEEKKQTTYSVHCTPSKYTRVDSASSLANIYVVFNGKNGLNDPRVYVRLATESGIPSGGLFVFDGTLLSQDNNKLVFKTKFYCGGGCMLSPLSLEKVTLNFSNISVGTKGTAVAQKPDYSTAPELGGDDPSLKIKLNCFVSDKLPKR